MNRPTIPSDMSAGFGLRLAKRLADPKVRDALRYQQKGTVLRRYGALLERWHVTGPAATAVLDALADYQLQQLVSASGASNPSGGSAADDTAIGAVLSEKQLQELRAYDSSIAERALIAPLLSELQFEGTPLPEDQVEQLVDIMHQERIAIPRPDAPTSPQDLASYTEASNEWQVSLDQRVRDRADGILSPDVIGQLETFQNSRRAARSVFASIGSEIAAAARAAPSGH